MPLLPLPASGLPKSPSTPPRMPTVSLNALSRRKTPVQDENASVSRIPVRSPPRSILGRPLNHNAPRSPTPNKKLSVKFEGKCPIPFPKSTRPASPVVTASHATIEDAPLPALNIAPRKPSLLGRRLRPSKATKGKEKDGKCQIETYGTAWKTLLNRGKAVIGQTLDRDLLTQQQWAYNATWMTPGLLREGLNDVDRTFHAWAGFKRAIRDRHIDDWDLLGVLKEAMNRYLVSLGVEQLEEVAGPHFTFLDPRSANSPRTLVKQAGELVKLFKAEGYGTERIVFSIPATEEGILAARRLEQKYGLKTNLLFVSGLAHAAICAQAGASFVTFPYTTLAKASVQKSVRNGLSRSESSKSPSSKSPTAKRLAEETIEATAEYFDMHGIATQILVSAENMADPSEALRLRGFNAVVLDTDQSLEAREPLSAMPPVSKLAAAETSPAKKRAREEKYPILASMDGALLSAMSAEAQDVAELTLQNILEDWRVRMNMFEEHMQGWMEHEIECAVTTARDIEGRYAQEWERLVAACNKGENPSPKFPMSEGHVGFRMTRTVWDRPEGWY